jgi:hypothetical protein
MCYNDIEKFLGFIISALVAADADFFMLWPCRFMVLASIKVSSFVWLYCHPALQSSNGHAKHINPGLQTFCTLLLFAFAILLCLLSNPVRKHHMRH